MSGSVPGDVVVVGGGMAGCAATWELSRGDWRSRHRSITVLEQSNVLGGKGTSTRGDDGRILEHGLHVWLGYYDNAFRLLREVYEELDRTTLDPESPIRTWRVLVPAPRIGVFEHDGSAIEPWLAAFPSNEHVPGDTADVGFADLVERGLDLAGTAVRSGLDARRSTALVDLVSTLVHGLSADGLLHRPGGFDRVDDEDFRAWLRRHGARDDTLASGLVRGMYDLVFAYRGGDRSMPAFSAGLGVFLAIRMFLDYKGSVFWKMTAGMGDVVFAPLHEALARRGVTICLGHEVERLEFDGDRVSAMCVAIRNGDDPRTRINGLDVYRHGDGGGSTRSSTTRRRGEDFDTIVLAASLASLRPMIGPLAQRPAWKAMLSDVATVATWAVQLWLRPDETELGSTPGVTMSALEAPLDTMASMTHVLPREAWDDDDPPRSLAYLCSSSTDSSDRNVEDRANDHLAAFGAALWPDRPITSLDDPAVRAHYCVSHDEGSDRYVQSLPGTGTSRLRVDGSGVDGLVLAGDWTDCGLNAGCIEAAVISGLQASAAVEQSPLTGRILGPLTWDFR